MLFIRQTHDPVSEENQFQPLLNIYLNNVYILIYKLPVPIALDYGLASNFDGTPLATPK